MVALPFMMMGAAAVSAGTQIAGGIAANKEAKVVAEGERQAAKDRTDQRLQRVRTLRSSQRVAAAGAGVDPNFGSSAAIGADVAEQYRAEQSADNYQTSLARSRIRAHGRNSRIMGFAGAATSLLQGGADAWSVGRRGGK